MKKVTLFVALLIASATTLYAQQSARLGSRQSISPLPKELTKDGKSYMAMVDVDSKTETASVGLYDSFGPSGIKKSIPIQVETYSEYYYEKASGYSEVVTIDNKYSNCVDYSKTYSTKSDIEAFLNKRFNRVYFVVKEFTTVNGDKAFYLSPESQIDGYSSNPENFFWNYKEYGEQYPWNYYVIDADKHLWQYSAYYEYENNAISMTITSQDCLDSNNTYSSKTDIEKYLKRDYYGYDVEDIVVTITEFTTLDGDKAYYINSSDSDQMKSLFWNYNMYGTKYPSYYVVTDENGYLMEYSVEYYLDIDLTNATWTRDMEYGSNDVYYYPNIFKYQYMNVDQSFYPTAPVFVSQNLFNNDDYWEYMSFDIEYSPRYYEPWTDSEGVVRREAYNRTIYKGIKIMNEAGTVLAYLKMPDEDNELTTYIEIKTLSILNGLIYITTDEYVSKENSHRNEYEGIYVIDPINTSVKSSMRAPARMELNTTVVEQGDRLNIQVSESGVNDNVTISSMNGQVLQTSDVNQGNPVLINTGAMPKGIYNVTLRGQGNPTENQRIIVK